MPGSGGFVAVAQLELFVRELAVEVEDFGCACNLFCHLDCEDGFADVGVGEEVADFAFVPE